MNRVLLGVFALFISACAGNRMNEKLCFKTNYIYRKAGENTFTQINECFMPNGDIRWEQFKYFEIGRN